MYRLTALLLLPWLAAAQLTPNSVTVTASRDLTAQADQVQFGITINSGTDASLDDVLAVAKGAGLTQVNFTGVNYSSFSSGIQPVTGAATLFVPRPPVAWSFVTATAISDMKSTIGLLTALQTNLAKEGKYALSFNVNGTQVSAKAQQALTCPISDLLADARAQAAKLATGAGLTVGAIQAISSPTIAAGGSLGLGSASLASIPVCTITAKFALGGL